MWAGRAAVPVRIGKNVFIWLLLIFQPHVFGLIMARKYPKPVTNIWWYNCLWLCIFYCLWSINNGDEMPKDVDWHFHLINHTSSCNFSSYFVFETWSLTLSKVQFHRVWEGLEYNTDLRVNLLNHGAVFMPFDTEHDIDVSPRISLILWILHLTVSHRTCDTKSTALGHDGKSCVS